MFNLSDKDLGNRILGCADGPASFNAELTSDGGNVVSLDPIYQFSPERLRQQISATSPKMVAHARQNPTSFRWSDQIPDAAALQSHRMRTMEIFLTDLKKGKVEGRYVAAQLPEIPFSQGSFDLVLCSHFLFLFTANLTLEFHLQSIRALLQVASELRIFPLVDLSSRRSPYVAPVTRTLRLNGYHVDVVPVEYHFQRGANQMMRVRR